MIQKPLNTSPLNTSFNQSTLYGSTVLRRGDQQQNHNHNHNSTAMAEGNEEQSKKNGDSKTQVQLDLPHPYVLHLLENGPQWKEFTLSRDEALAFYRKMLTVRRIESAAGRLYEEKEVRGFCHQSVGQEASPVGIASCLKQGDAVIDGYRIHGWSWLMGVSADEILSELTWRLHGNVHGKGGSMHLYRPGHFFGGHGIVGAQIPLGVGLAFAKRYKREPHISVVLYGDGAANQGQFYEAANMAALWKLPVLFVCENNGFGMSTPVHRASATPHMFNRLNYLPGILVDGMDVLSVHQAARWARQYALNNGPVVLELDTYRYVGHTTSDPGTGYRSQAEVAAMRKERDPISHFRAKILEQGLVEEEELQQIDTEVNKQLEAALQRAHSDEELPAEGLLTDIYANTEPQLVRGLTPGLSCTQKFTRTEDLLKAMGKLGGCGLGDGERK